MFIRRGFYDANLTNNIPTALQWAAANWPDPVQGIAVNHRLRQAAQKFLEEKYPALELHAFGGVFKNEIWLEVPEKEKTA